MTAAREAANKVTFGLIDWVSCGGTTGAKVVRTILAFCLIFCIGFTGFVGYVFFGARDDIAKYFLGVIATKQVIVDKSGEDTILVGMDSVGAIFSAVVILDLEKFRYRIVHAVAPDGASIGGLQNIQDSLPSGSSGYRDAIDKVLMGEVHCEVIAKPTVKIPRLWAAAYSSGARFYCISSIPPEYGDTAGAFVMFFAEAPDVEDVPNIRVELRDTASALYK